MATPRTTARWTGAFYLGLAAAGFIGFLFARNELFVADDAAATLANLVDRPSLARLGIAADLTVVLAQALTAVCFFKLFRTENPAAAGMIAAFGLVNATAVLVATAFSATALVVAGDASSATGGDQAATVQMLYQLSTGLWGIGGLFFGLWLIPMGHVAATSRLMPIPLGWLLIAGGAAYVVSTYLGQLAPSSPAFVEGMLVGLASVGEFWMIGYLLVFGVREPHPIATE